MLRSIRNTSFTRFFWGLMGLYLLNISVDGPNHLPIELAEDLTINHQESILEIVVEKLLGFENAIVEYDDHDMEDKNKSGSNSIDTVVFFSPYPELAQDIDAMMERGFINFSSQLSSGHYLLFTPPPES